MYSDPVLCHGVTSLAQGTILITFLAYIVSLKEGKLTDTKEEAAPLKTPWCVLFCSFAC